MPKLIMRKGDIVEIKFWDHSIGAKGHTLPKCTIWGRVGRINKRDIVLHVWELSNPESKWDAEANKETIRVIRSTITSIRRLK